MSPNPLLIPWRLSRGRPRLGISARRTHGSRHELQGKHEVLRLIKHRPLLVETFSTQPAGRLFGRSDYAAGKRSRKSKRGRGDSLPLVKPIALFFPALRLCTTYATLPWNLFRRCNVYVFYESCSMNAKTILFAIMPCVIEAHYITRRDRRAGFICRCVDKEVIISVKLKISDFFENNANAWYKKAE